MRRMDADVVVVGAGAVGLACAAELSRAGLAVVVAERHASPGQETSSRNSQVLHAGIYYPEGSLKARLCVRGNRSLSEFCETHGVPFRRIGKWLLAVEPDEEARLAEVVAGGRANGVDLEEVPLARFRAEEPHVRAVAAVLSPSTGILDVHGLFRALRVIAEENGASFAFRHALTAAAPVPGGYELVFDDPSGEEVRLTAPRVVNAAGLDADLVAAMPGLDVDAAGYRLPGRRGATSGSAAAQRHLARRLLYPVLPRGLRERPRHPPHGRPRRRAEARTRRRGPGERRQDYAVRRGAARRPSSRPRGATSRRSRRTTSRRTSPGSGRASRRLGAPSGTSSSRRSRRAAFPAG